MIMVAIGRSILSSVGTVTENAEDGEEKVLNERSISSISWLQEINMLFQLLSKTRCLLSYDL